MTVTVHLVFCPLTTRRHLPPSKCNGPRKGCLCRPVSVWVREEDLGLEPPWGPDTLGPPLERGPARPKMGTIGTNDTDGGVLGRAAPPSPPAWAGVPRRHTQRRPHHQGGAPVLTPTTVPPNTIPGRRPARRQRKNNSELFAKVFLFGAGGGFSPDTAAHASGDRRRPGREKLILLLLDEPKKRARGRLPFSFFIPFPTL